MKHSAHFHPARGQRGITLIMVLLILIVVTVLGIGAAQIALLGERSTRYDRDYLIASQGAEAALLDAEYDIRGPIISSTNRVASFTPTNIDVFVTNCGTDAATRGLCAPAPLGAAKEVWETVDFSDTSATAHSVQFGTYTGRVFDAGSSGIQPAQAPRYIIELVPDLTPSGNASSQASPLPTFYRVTAIGFGPRQDIQVVMQMAFRKELP